MDPVIAAACISGGVGALGVVGAVVTSVVGSRNTRRATEATVEAGNASTRATLLAAHDAWLRDRRASAYEAMLTQLLHHQAERNFDMWNIGTEDHVKIKEFYETYELPGMFETQGRLVAYASDTVLEAFYVSRKAHARVRAEYSRWEGLREPARQRHRSGTAKGTPSPDALSEARHEVETALKPADRADQALIEVIRAEIPRMPDAALQPVTALPAVRRRFLRRRRE